MNFHQAIFTVPAASRLVTGKHALQVVDVEVHPGDHDADPGVAREEVARAQVAVGVGPERGHANMILHKFFMKIHVFSKKLCFSDKNCLCAVSTKSFFLSLYEYKLCLSQP